MNALDYAILWGTLVGIAAYALWRTRGGADLGTYLRGGGQSGWLTIGLSVMATQASAITFLSTPGQGYESGLGFVQNYFGAPLALVVVAAFFVPLYRRLKVYTAYEYLGHRFDQKTRLLGAGFFLLQRGLGAGITLYAPAIVLSTVFGWRLDSTIVCSGLLVVAYTVVGGCDAVSLTQKYQIGVIFAGMAAAFAVVLARLPSGVTPGDALALAGGFHRLDGVDFSLSPERRYTVWTGLLGGMFLALSYFGTDQSQVQRYLGGSSARESRLGLMFNAVLKIPMQALILLLGVLIFVFYQFERPPVHFNRTAWVREAARSPSLAAFESRFNAAHDEERAQIGAWLAARHAKDGAGEASHRALARAAAARATSERDGATRALRQADPAGSANDADYVFITFIIDHLPHGLIGVLVTAFFAAALSSKAGELNALGSTTTVDIYRHVFAGDADDAHCLAASKVFTALWGLVAIGFALFANLSENLIQAVNILGSIFYGVVLGLFLLAFFVKRVGGTAAFWAAIGAQALVFVLYRELTISYLWYNLIGCAACMALAAALQALLGHGGHGPREVAA